MRWLLALLLCIAALWAAHCCVQHHAASIQDDIDHRAQMALADAPWASHAVDGRDVRLGGTPPGADAGDAVAARVGALAGVRTLTTDWSRGAPARTAALVLTAQTLHSDTGHNLHLAGVVADARQARAIVRYAAARRPAARIDNLLRTADDNAADPTFAAALAAGLQALMDLDHGTLQVTPQRVTLRGMAPAGIAQLALEQRLRRNTPPAVGLDVQLQALQRTRSRAAALAPAMQRCQDEFDALMRNHRIRFGHDADTIAPDSTPAYNLDLSTRRARSVRQALIARGVPAGRLLARGFGDSRPIADNDTPEGRARNRRIEFRLLPASAP